MGWKYLAGHLNSGGIRPTDGHLDKKADMSTARGWLSTGVVDGKIYAIGGASELFSVATTLPIVEEYTPEGWQPTTVSPQGKLTTTWGEIKQH